MTGFFTSNIALQNIALQKDFGAGGGIDIFIIFIEVMFHRWLYCTLNMYSLLYINTSIKL